MAGTPEEKEGGSRERDREYYRGWRMGREGDQSSSSSLSSSCEEGRKEVVSGRLDKGTWHEDQAYNL